MKDKIPTNVPAGTTIPLSRGGATGTWGVNPSQPQKASTAAAGMPRASQSPVGATGAETPPPQTEADKADIYSTTYTGSSPTAGPAQTNPLDMQEAIYQMDKKSRNIADLQEQKNALLGVLYQSNVPPEQMAKLTPEQALSIKSGRRELIDQQVRSINNQIEGRYADADTALKFFTNYQTQQNDNKKILADLIKDPEGQTFLKNNAPADLLKSLGLDSINFGETGGSYAPQVTSTLQMAGLSDPSMPLSQAVTMVGLDKLANAVIQQEGGSPAGVINNPGNVKFQGLPGQIDSGVKAKDGGTFASYASPQAGVQSVKNQINVVMSNQSKNYPQNATVGDFVSIYKGFGTPKPTSEASQLIDSIRLSRIAKEDKAVLIDEIQGLSNSGLSREEVQNEIETKLFTKASDANKVKYGESIDFSSKLDSVLGAIDDGSFKQEHGIFTSGYRAAARELGQASGYGDSIRALFQASTAAKRKELFGATLTKDEQASAGAFLPTDKDSTEVLREKVQTLKDMMEISKMTSLGLMPKDSVAKLAVERNKRLNVLKNGGTNIKSESGSGSKVDEDTQAIFDKYNNL